MSAYTEVSCPTISDGVLLREALADHLGCPIEAILLFEEGTTLYGYQGDRRTQVAHLVLPGCGRVSKNPGMKQLAPGSSNDVGFERIMVNGKEQWKLHVSDYDRAYHNTEWVQRVLGRYMELQVRKNAKKNGYSVIEKVENGKKILKLQRYVG